jgi:phage baseplate assembly protein W
MSSYIDFDLSFAPHPVTGDLIVRKDGSAVIQSIRNILMTKLGELGFDEDFGSDVPSRLFDLIDPNLEYNLKDKIIWAINTYEPRADIDFVDMNIDRENNTVSANIQFYILNQEQPYSMSIGLGRLR